MILTYFQWKGTRKKYKKYPKFVEAIIRRHQVYNQTLADIKEYVASGDVFALYPSIPIDLPLLVRDPEDLQRVYEIGVRDTRERMEALKAWMSDVR